MGSRKINAAPDISIAEEALGDTSTRHRDGSMDMAGWALQGLHTGPVGGRRRRPQDDGRIGTQLGLGLWEREIVGMKN